MATGSELQIAVEARTALEAEGVSTRVVSMPCVDWFVEQDEAYRESVLPAAVRARVSVEAGIAQPWYRFTGDARRERLDRALRGQRRLPDPVPGVRLHHRERRRRGPPQPRQDLLRRQT